jgi:hypothetical protein
VQGGLRAGGKDLDRHDCRTRRPGSSFQQTTTAPADVDRMTQIRMIRALSRTQSMPLPGVPNRSARPRPGQPQVSEGRLHQIANGCWLRGLAWIVDCQPATVRKHREMNPGASDAMSPFAEPGPVPMGGTTWCRCRAITRPPALHKIGDRPGQRLGPIQITCSGTITELAPGYRRSRRCASRLGR